jgi:Na+/phosphate symporter
MGEQVLRMLRRVRDGFVHFDVAPLQEVARTAQAVHRQERALIDLMVKRAATVNLRVDKEDEAVFLPMHLDRIVSNIEMLAADAERVVREGALFTDRATREIKGLLDGVIQVSEDLYDALRTGNRTLVRSILDGGRECEARAHEYALQHEQRLIEGVCQPRASSIYLAMLDHLRGIEWHSRQLAEKLVPGTYVNAQR